MPADLKLDLPDFAKTFHVWSFWDEQYLGIGKHGFVVRAVPPHGCVLLRLTPVNGEPTFIGSNLHITMGTAEVAVTEVANGVSAWGLTDAGAREGALFFVSRHKLAIAGVYGLKVTALTRMGNVWRVGVKNRQRGRSQRLMLKSDNPGYSLKSM